jgi:hypothetical protein
VFISEGTAIADHLSELFTQGKFSNLSQDIRQGLVLLHLFFVVPYSSPSRKHILSKEIQPSPLSIVRKRRTFAVIRRNCISTTIRIPEPVLEFLSAHPQRGLPAIVITFHALTIQVVPHRLLSETLEHDGRRVAITRKQPTSGVRSLREDLGSGLVPDCDLEGVEARPRNPYVPDALLLQQLEPPAHLAEQKARDKRSQVLRILAMLKLCSRRPARQILQRGE